MPKRLVHGARFFQLDYNPIWKDGSTDVLSAVLVVVRDITSTVERERVEWLRRAGPEGGIDERDRSGVEGVALGVDRR